MTEPSLGRRQSSREDFPRIHQVRRIQGLLELGHDRDAFAVLIRNYGLTPTEFGGWMGEGLLLAGIVGSVIGGFSADWGHRLKRRGGMSLPP